MLKNFLVILTLLFGLDGFAMPQTLSDGFIIKYKNKNAMLNSFQKDFFQPLTGLNKTFSHKDDVRIIKGMNMLVVKEYPKQFSRVDIEYIEPNFIYHISAIPNDTRFSEQWGHTKIEAEKAWDISVGNKDAIVAVIDTGVNYNHPELKDNSWVNEKELNGVAGVDDDSNGFIDDIHGYDFANKDADPMDDHGHGSHCSGIIGAAQDGNGIVGINWQTRIMALKFLKADGSGSLEDAILAIKYGADNGAKVLSNSWGGGGYSQAMFDVIKYAQDKGVLFVAAAGNEGTDQKGYPASYSLANVISVAASTPEDTKAKFSNYGTPHTHIAAPGTKILSTITGAEYAAWDGTSMACPHVAGAAMLLLAHEPNLAYTDIKERILGTSDYLPNWEDVTLTGGRLNLYNMLMNIRPERPAKPDSNSWIKKEVSISSEHPYKNKENAVFTLEIPEEAKFLRIHFSKFKTESNFDMLTVKGKKVLKLSGELNTFTSDFFGVFGMTSILLEFKTDTSQVLYGFDIDYIEYQ